VLVGEFVLGDADEVGLPQAESDAYLVVPAEPEVADLLPNAVTMPVTEEIPLDSFDRPATDGALFFRNQRMGRPAGEQLISAGPRHDRHSERAENILSSLLPVLLPPASSEFAQVFVLPSDLYAFQLDGIKFLTNDQPGRLLADDMGLGKTVQAIVAMRHLFREGKSTRALVVSPKSVQTSWSRHLAEWAPELVVQTIAGIPNERRSKWLALAQRKAHVALVTYQTLRSDVQNGIAPGQLDLLICDEVQNIKNRSSAQSKAVRSLPAARRWGLSGTPLENSLEEFVTVLNFLDSEAISLSEFRERIVRDVAENLMLRRTKEVIRDQLPSIVRNLEYLELTPAQRAAYDSAEKSGIARLQGRDISVTNVLALISALKQICNGVGGASAKTEWLSDYLDITSQEGDRSIVFSQYVAPIEELASELARHRPLKYTGDMSVAQRDAVVGEFETDASRRVMLLSLRAGGTGLDRLQYAANRVIHFDSWWNPAVMDQATARVYRIGQVKGVFETTLVSSDTVEERIQEILEEKREIFTRVVDDLSVEGLARALSEDELFGLFGLKSPRRGSERVELAVEAARQLSEPDVSSPPIPEPASAGSVISGATPYRNVVSIRRIIRAAVGTLWWVDPNFSRRALEDLSSEIDPRNLRAIRILSRDLSIRDWNDFRRFRAEAETAGVAAEWRVLPGRDFHDRFIADDNGCLNIPPVNLIYDASAPYSQITEAPERPPFEEWWEGAGFPDPSRLR
jgi:superfamily II DNA or RNA helicase